jgi:hypothetical protein
MKKSTKEEIESLLIKRIDELLLNVDEYRLLCSIADTQITKKRTVPCPATWDNMQFLQDFKFEIGNPIFYMKDGELCVYNDPPSYQCESVAQSIFNHLLYENRMRYKTCGESTHYQSTGVVKQINRSIDLENSYSFKNDVCKFIFDGSESNEKILIINPFYLEDLLLSCEKESLPVKKKIYANITFHEISFGKKKIFAFPTICCHQNKLHALDMKYVRVYEMSDKVKYNSLGVSIIKTRAMVLTKVEEHSTVRFMETYQ